MDKTGREGVMLSDGSIWWIVEKTDTTITIIPYQRTNGTQGQTAKLLIAVCVATNTTYKVQP